MKKYALIIPIAFILAIASCTDLNEPLYDQIDAREFYNSQDEIQAGLTNAYYKLMELEIWIHQFILQEVTTEIAIVPTRTNGGWNDGGRWNDAHLHTWDAAHQEVTETYSKLYNVVASANSLVELLKEREGEIEDVDEAIAEMRALRAYAYLNLLDLYGNVPIVTDAQIDPNNLPSNLNTTRADVFEFVEQELTDALENIPAVAEMSMAERQDYYPRFSKEAVQAMLVRLYLNAEVYSGSQRWQDVIRVADEIIASGAFSLTPNIWDNFAPENENSPETILAISQSNQDITVCNFCAQGGNWINQLGLHPNLQQKFNLPISPWGGTNVSVDHFEDYEEDDFRRTLILRGEQKSESGEVLVDLVPVSNLNNSPFNEGYKSIKYQPDPQMVGISARNDQILIRYSEILLSKAEAHYRLGQVGPALDLVNQVRERNFDSYTPLTTLTEEMILKEFAREFMWETHHRTHLIRHGKFLTNRYKFKDYDSEPHRIVFPIPQNELDRNPNLKQNPGY